MTFYCCHRLRSVAIRYAFPVCRHRSFLGSLPRRTSYLNYALLGDATLDFGVRSCGMAVTSETKEYILNQSRLFVTLDDLGSET